MEIKKESFVDIDFINCSSLRQDEYINCKMSDENESKIESNVIFSGANCEPKLNNESNPSFVKETCFPNKMEKDPLSLGYEDVRVKVEDQESIENSNQDIKNPFKFISCGLKIEDYTDLALNSTKFTSEIAESEKSDLAFNSMESTSEVAESGEPDLVMKSTSEIAESEKPFGCDICLRRFNQKANCRKHMRTHSAERRYSCDICGKQFTNSDNLRLHYRIHTGVTPYTCQICNKKFSQTSALTRHIRIHTGEKPYRCDICGHRSAQSSALKKHLRTHTGERPYNCYICHKVFARSDHLRTHSFMHSAEKS